MDICLLDYETCLHKSVDVSHEELKGSLSLPIVGFSPPLNLLPIANYSNDLCMVQRTLNIAGIVRIHGEISTVKTSEMT